MGKPELKKKKKQEEEEEEEEEEGMNGLAKDQQLISRLKTFGEFIIEGCKNLKSGSQVQVLSVLSKMTIIDHLFKTRERK